MDWIGIDNFSLCPHLIKKQRLPFLQQVFKFIGRNINRDKLLLLSGHSTFYYQFAMERDCYANYI